LDNSDFEDDLESSLDDDIDDDIDQKLQIKLREAAEPDHGPALDEDSDGFPEAAEK